MRLDRAFFERDVLEVAPDLLGKTLVRRIPHHLRGDHPATSEELRGMITEVEAYRGEEDRACHARFGRTKRTEALYGEAGTVYVYLIYGLYWMLNIVTGKKDDPQAVLVRSLKIEDGSWNSKVEGPGRVGKWVKLDKSFYGENISSSRRIWIEQTKNFGDYVQQTPRIGVDYAGEWAKKPWRFLLRTGETNA